MPKGATSIGKPPPALSSTAHGIGEPRAVAMRWRSLTPTSRRSPIKRSPTSTRNSASASHRLAACHTDASGLTLPIREASTRASRRCEWHDAVHLQRRVDVSPRRVTFGRRMEKYKSRACWRCGDGSGRLVARMFCCAVTQFSQAFDQPSLEATQCLEIVVVGLPQFKAQRRSIFGIVKDESRYCVAALVAQEVWPEVDVGLLSADDEQAANVARPTLKSFWNHSRSSPHQLDLRYRLDITIISTPHALAFTLSSGVR
jgi:hypothetical protein